MIIIGKIENRLIILAITLLLVIFISFLDYITGSELSFSIFYLIPISFLALYRNTKALSVLICTIFASLLWFIVEYKTREYSNIFFPIWNTFVRLAMFTAIGLLLYLKEKDKKLNLVNRDL